MAVCFVCNCEVADNANFCPNCKARISHEVSAGKSSVVIVEDQSGSPAKRLLKVIIPVVAAVLILAVGIGIFSSHISNQDKKNVMLYYKEGAVYLGSNRFESVKLFEAAEGYDSVGVVYSEDCKNLFFTTDRTEGDYTLKCVDTSKPEDAVTVSKNVTNYQISANGKTVVYVKGGALYKSDLDESKKIMDKVASYSVSKNGKKVVFLTRDSKLYMFKGDEKTKIASDVSSFVKSSADNFSNIHYVKDGNLYLYDGKNNKKIANNVAYVVGAYKSGAVHYVKAKQSTVTLADFIEDDMKENDAKFTADANPSALQQKQLRDQIRAQAKNMILQINLADLYYYNGSKEVLVTDTLTGVTLTSDKKAIAYTAYSAEEMQKIRISEISGVDRLSPLITERFFAELKNCVAIGDYGAVIDGFRIFFNPSGTKFYYLSGQTVYTGDLSAGGLSRGAYFCNADELELYGDTVVTQKKYLPQGEEAVYSFETYINGHQIAQNSQGIYSDPENKYFCVIDKEENGVTKLIGANENTRREIAEGVNTAIVTSEGTFYYLVKGELFSYKKEKIHSIEKDVSHFVVPNSYQIHNIMNADIA